MFEIDKIKGEIKDIREETKKDISAKNLLRNVEKTFENDLSLITKKQKTPTFNKEEAKQKTLNFLKKGILSLFILLIFSLLINFSSIVTDF